MTMDQRFTAAFRLVALGMPFEAAWKSTWGGAGASALDVHDIAEASVRQLLKGRGSGAEAGAPHLLPLYGVRPEDGRLLHLRSEFPFPGGIDPAFKDDPVANADDEFLRSLGIDPGTPPVD
jgi:hypothetical protein